MPTSMKKFLKLYCKEMHDLRPEILVIIITTLVIDVYFYFKFQDMPSIVIGPLVMILGLASLLPFISSFKLLNREFSTNTAYLLLSLPVKGGSILGSKLLALLSQYVIGTLVVGIAGVILISLLFPEPGLEEVISQAQAAGIDINLQSLFSMVGLFYLMSIVSIAYAIVISFFSQLTGKLVKRFSGLITVIIFLATFWLMGKLLTPLWQQLGNFTHYYMNNHSFSVAAFNGIMGLNTLIILLGTALVFLAAVLIYNHRIEL
ncbi:MAG: hypothetical protein ACOX6E_00710 [Syntrophomonadaceae bacterium]|jgi:ABC-type transport system involved in multi-copper enzyme maturation permease subunit